MKPTTLAAASVAALALVVPASAALAASGGSGDTQVAKRGLVTPLSLDVNNSAAAYVSENFTGQLVKLKKGKDPKVLVRAAEGREIGAVDVRGATVTFAVSWGENEEGIVRQWKKGEATTIANLREAELEHNPDQVNTYGFAEITEECAAQYPEEEFGPATYTGIVEVHPYATAVRGRTVYVADAGANAIWKIADGEVSPVAALPPVGVVISAEQAEAFGMPECVAGLTYYFEPVPTDLELLPGGDLVVTSLPGGPEDPSLGANGAVLRLDPDSGEFTKLAGGLTSATGVAVAPNGDMYVSELFANRITMIPAAGGEPTLFRDAVMPAALEVKGRYLYATTNVLSGMSGEPGDVPNGKVMRFRR